MSTAISTSEQAPLGSTHNRSKRRSTLRRSRPVSPPNDDDDIPRVIFIPCYVEPLDRWSPESGIPSVIGGGNTLNQWSKRQHGGRCSVSAALSRLEITSIQFPTDTRAGKIGSSVGTHSITKSAMSGSQQDGSNSSGVVRRRPSTEPPSLPRRQHSSCELDLTS